MSIWFGYYCVDDLLVMMDGLAVLLRLPATNTGDDCDDGWTCCWHSCSDLVRNRTLSRSVCLLRLTLTPYCVIVLCAVATTIGTVVAFLIVPMRSLGPDNWKIAAALMSRHIGGGEVACPACLLHCIATRDN
jgi:hypothetical protein